MTTKSTQQDLQELEQEEFLSVEPVSDDDMRETAMAKLEPKQQRFVHMYLSGNYKMYQIAEALSVTPNTIYRWLRNPNIKSLVMEYQKQEEEIVGHNLLALRLKALNAMNDLLDSNMDAIKYQAARDILDRTGFKPSTKQNVTVEVFNYEKQLQEIVSGTSYEVSDDSD